MTDENLGLLLERFREFTIDIEARKKRGQNDFNPLLCVQKLDDEANMHSGFLYALLNPCGEHYQDDLFLKLFLKSIGLKEWFGDTNNAEVYKEYKNIDIYITNNNKHIIIENKIWARDQGTQIARYIEAIAEVDSSDERESSVEYENIAVVYLAPYIKNPTQQSLGKWKIQGEFLVDNENNKVRFKAISYDNEMIDWLEYALNEAGGISNLRMAIECYTDVVKRLTGKKDNTMDLQAFFNKKGNERFLEIALELVARRDEVLHAHFSAIAREIESKYKKDYEINDLGNGKGITLLHSKFDEIKNFCFYIAAEITDKEKISLNIYLCNSKSNTEQRKSIIKKIKEVLDVNDEAFNPYRFQYNKYDLTLKEFKEIDLKDFTQERFINFFESVRKQTDEFNQKIADDLAKGQDSKLRKFLTDEDD
ncbi:MAG: PD-(D/E)XK nuclease family protein [Helicobacter sp.]|uniref:PDDEXK-like family protein n=1 Tax=Helicobacter sp. TaxID=218 RepID=UPI002A916850|nr:PD-(D/E)XK nuclease family protein [Helicobacter sp.]MDY5822811.1 PD-(D/E)XK nuclease family protein [Helicobacter sp.]